MIAPPHPLVAFASNQAQNAGLLKKAEELEAAFLAEMLSFSGLGAVSEEFGGGIGEEQFASFLRQEQAKILVCQGGVGLAERIFESLKARGE